MTIGTKIDVIISNCFEDIIYEFEFQLKNNSNRLDQEIHLFNDKCIIRFIYYMGSVSCDFINPLEKKKSLKEIRKDGMPSGFPVYQIIPLWRFLYPNDKADFRYGGNDIEKQVIAIKRLILERLSNVIQGDFSWSMNYKTLNNRLSKKIEYMMTHWSPDNSVSVSFKKGNINWENEFDDYKNKLDNL